MSRTMSCRFIFQILEFGSEFLLYQHFDKSNYLFFLICLETDSIPLVTLQFGCSRIYA
ncbi:hypothetical protein BC943DRAFT_321993 [Umbelopsis sp. AD052]|nr:hypothetical protein BC943DRAFT_321993 [Umbelopsis sp. AD052]